MPRIQYVAFDGKYFDAIQTCADYEEALIDRLKPSIISQWIDEHCVVVDYRNEEVTCDPAPLFDHMNNPDNSLLTQAFLEAFVENLNAANCAYLAQILDPKPTEKTSNAN